MNILCNVRISCNSIEGDLKGNYQACEIDIFVKCCFTDLYIYMYIVYAAKHQVPCMRS